MKSVFICGGTRSPIGAYGKSLAYTRADDLAAHVIASLLAQNQSIEPSCIDEVVLGCANQAGEDNRNVARMASLLAGLPESVPAITVNRLCASGLDAVATAARLIMTGEAGLVIAGGVENMSRAPFVMPKTEIGFSRDNVVFDTTIGWRFVNALMQKQYGIDSMPETAENVAENFDVSREHQDAFALRSQIRARMAIKSGRLAKEITPIDVKKSKSVAVMFAQDERVRETSIDKLAMLPTLRQNGSVTAGNAAGINDGAAALILADEENIKRFNLAPIARLGATLAAGVSPRIMGIGPVIACERLMQHLNMQISDFDIIEINEAFASQSLAVLRQLHIPDDAPHVNPNGGAIALGHPLGMSGARLALSASLELKYQNAKHALVMMCVGVGQGVAMALHNV